MDLSDLFKRANIALAIIGALLLVFAALGSFPFGNQPASITDPILRYGIAVVGLALLAVGTSLVIREQGERARKPVALDKDQTENPKSLKSSVSNAPLEDFPSNLKSDFENAEEVWLVGVSLVHTIQHDYHVINEKLRKGHSVKVLVVDPKIDAFIEPAVRRSEKGTTIESKRDEIRKTLQMLCELRQQTSDKLQIRTIQYPLGYGAHVLHPGKSSGALYIKLYPYKLRAAKPILVLHESEGGWYDYYLKEIRALWDDGIDWNCEHDA